ncbi:MAG: alkane 1-monooxygenase [Bacteroidota bacterium]|nr:alkane 1-monooxygenase [Bacteroidota bacterium]
MPVKTLKYLSPAIVYVLAFIAFSFTGWVTWIAMLYAWLFLPLIELIIKPDSKNLDEAEIEIAKADKYYDYLLYFFVVLQFTALLYFLFVMRNTEQLSLWEVAARILTMGLLCGSFGINVGHELGHRINKFERALAKAALLTSLYMHFKIEHNKGHHKKVATPDDPASARYNESLYAFYFRTIIFSYFSAWHIANEEVMKKGLPVWHYKNEMLQAQIIQVVFVAIIFFFFGWVVTAYYLLSAFAGILLLETVNYIEHYGLQRKPITDGKYERAQPQHSWNSNHILGRLMLFELSRHSDHHYLASKKYQLLQHHDNAPQLPTGYPGSMLLSLIPPVWFYIMNRKIKAMQLNH